MAVWLRSVVILMREREDARRNTHANYPPFSGQPASRAQHDAQAAIKHC
jgi:hypothetical protein